MDRMHDLRRSESPNCSKQGGALSKQAGHTGDTWCGYPGGCLWICGIGDTRSSLAVLIKERDGEQTTRIARD